MVGGETEAPDVRISRRFGRPSRGVHGGGFGRPILDTIAICDVSSRGPNAFVLAVFITTSFRVFDLDPLGARKVSALVVAEEAFFDLLRVWNADRAWRCVLAALGVDAQLGLGARKVSAGLLREVTATHAIGASVVFVGGVAVGRASFLLGVPPAILPTLLALLLHHGVAAGAFVA